jgi:hypothetical protein
MVWPSLTATGQEDLVMGHRLVWAAPAAIAVLCVATPALAATVEVETVNFRAFAPAVRFDFFDTTKGVLEQVELSITGSMNLDFVAAGNTTGSILPVPVPYFPVARIGHDFGGVVDTVLPPAFLLSLAAPGTNSFPIATVVPFRYDLTFDAASDLLQTIIAAPISPFAASGGQLAASRSDFSVDEPGMPALLTLMPRVLSGTDPRLRLTGGELTGQLRVSYTYSPKISTPTPTTPPVPLPAGLPLFVTAVLSLTLLRSR